MDVTSTSTPAPATPAVPAPITPAPATPVVSAPITPAPAAPAPAPAPASAAPADWRASLPEDLRDHVAFKPFKDVGDMAKSLLHAQKLVGMDRANFVTLPAEDAPAEEQAAFFSKLGRPEAPEGYQFKVEKLPEGVAIDENLEKWFRATAHGAGLTAKQAQALYESQVAYMGEAAQTQYRALEQKAHACEEELRREWGAAYDTNVRKAAAPLAKNADPSLIEYLNETGLGSDPRFLRAMHAINAKMGEDTVGDATQADAAMAPAAASSEISRLYADPNFMQAYMSKDHQSHSWAVGRMNQLHAFAAGKRG